MTSQKKIKRSNRQTTLHVYIEEANKNFLVKRAKKAGVSLSYYVNMLLTQLR